MKLYFFLIIAALIFSDYGIKQTNINLSPNNDSG